MTALAQVTPPVLERYEMKYLIPAEMIEPVSRFASIYCSLDKYSQASPDLFYRVNNLYFDTPTFLFLRNRLDDCESRFNMRVRSYGDHPKLPYFLEIKQKRAGFIRKYRGRVYEKDWYRLLGPDGGALAPDGDAPEAKNVRLFQRVAYAYNAEPKILTQYRRKAYVSNHEEYARLTMDLDLRYMEEPEYNLCPSEAHMCACDHVLHFEPGCSVILELKAYATHVPMWMMDLVKTFDLQSRGFSKYMTGIIEVLGVVDPPLVRQSTFAF